MDFDAEDIDGNMIEDFDLLCPTTPESPGDLVTTADGRAQPGCNVCHDDK
jgi:hypothetical protein